jgi:phage tail-like protein
MALPVTGDLTHPFLNAQFRLQIDGLAMGDFAECSGLAGEVSVEEYQEGGENRFAHKFPSRGGHPNLVLKRGTGISDQLWRWYEEFTSKGLVAPRDGQGLLLSSVDGEIATVRAWSFVGGWPIKINGPDLNATSPGVAIEAVELVHRGLKLVRLV